MSLTVRRLTYGAIFVVAFTTYVLRAHGTGTLTYPAERGDSFDYEAIAFNLWKGNGYGYNWSDPEFRAPYEKFPRYGDVLRRHSSYYPTTYRPPALPYLLSLLYKVAGRNFAAWRILNCAIVAGAVTLAAAVSVHFAGLAAGPVAAALLLQSPQLTRYSQMFMTEGLAMFLIALLACIWLRQVRKQWTLGSAVASGLVLGGLMAVRSIYMIWVPMALFAPGRDPGGQRWAWRAKGICLLACLVVIGPWWVRNIAVTGAFMPAGTQAPLNLPAGFGPQALQYEGLWRSIRDDEPKKLQAENIDPYSVTFEVRLAQARSARTLAWMREHPTDVARLMGLHVWQELRPRGHLLWDLLLPAAAIAAVVFRKSPGIGIIVLMVAANIVSVALTWGAGGRFMIPVQPLLLALVGAMLVHAARQGTTALQRVRAGGAAP